MYSILRQTLMIPRAKACYIALYKTKSTIEGKVNMYSYLRLTYPILQMFYPHIAIDKFKFYVQPYQDSKDFTIFLDKGTSNTSYTYHGDYLNLSLSNIIDYQAYGFTTDKQTRCYMREFFGNRIEMYKT